MDDVRSAAQQWLSRRRSSVDADSAKRAAAAASVAAAAKSPKLSAASGNVDEHPAGSAPALASPDMAIKREEINAAKAKRNSLASRGPVSRRLLELAEKDGPVDIVKLPNGARPVSSVVPARSNTAIKEHMKEQASAQQSLMHHDGDEANAPASDGSFDGVEDDQYDDENFDESDGEGSEIEEELKAAANLRSPGQVLMGIGHATGMAVRRDGGDTLVPIPLQLQLSPGSPASPRSGSPIAPARSRGDAGVVLSSSFAGVAAARDSRASSSETATGMLNSSMVQTVTVTVPDPAQAEEIRNLRRECADIASQLNLERQKNASLEQQLALERVRTSSASDVAAQVESRAAQADRRAEASEQSAHALKAKLAEADAAMLQYRRSAEQAQHAVEAERQRADRLQAQADQARSDSEQLTARERSSRDVAESAAATHKQRADASELAMQRSESQLASLRRQLQDTEVKLQRLAAQLEMSEESRGQLSESLARAEAAAQHESDGRHAADARLVLEADARARAESRLQAELDTKSALEARVRAEVDARSRAEGRLTAEVEARQRLEATIAVRAEADAKNRAEFEKAAFESAKRKVELEFESRSEALRAEAQFKTEQSREALAVANDARKQLETMQQLLEKTRANAEKDRKRASDAEKLKAGAETAAAEEARAWKIKIAGLETQVANLSHELDVAKKEIGRLSSLPPPPPQLPDANLLLKMDQKRRAASASRNRPSASSASLSTTAVRTKEVVSITNEQVARQKALAESAEREKRDRPVNYPVLSASSSSSAANVNTSRLGWNGDSSLASPPAPVSTDEYHAELAAHRRAVQEYEQKIERLQTALNDARDVARRSREEVLQSREELESLTSDLLRVDSIAVAAGERLADITASYSHAQQSVAKLRRHVEELEGGPCRHGYTFTIVGHTAGGLTDDNVGVADAELSAIAPFESSSAPVANAPPTASATSARSGAQPMPYVGMESTSAALSPVQVPSSTLPSVHALLADSSASGTNDHGSTNGDGPASSPRRSMIASQAMLHHALGTSAGVASPARGRQPSSSSAPTHLNASAMQSTSTAAAGAADRGRHPLGFGSSSPRPVYVGNTTSDVLHSIPSSGSQEAVREQANARREHMARSLSPVATARASRTASPSRSRRPLVQVYSPSGIVVSPSPLPNPLPTSIAAAAVAHEAGKHSMSSPARSPTSRSGIIPGTEGLSPQAAAIAAITAAGGPIPWSSSGYGQQNARSSSPWRLQLEPSTGSAVSEAGADHGAGRSSPRRLRSPPRQQQHDNSGDARFAIQQVQHAAAQAVLESIANCEARATAAESSARQAMDDASMAAIGAHLRESAAVAQARSFQFQAESEHAVAERALGQLSASFGLQQASQLAPQHQTSSLPHDRQADSNYYASPAHHNSADGSHGHDHDQRHNDAAVREERQSSYSSYSFPALMTITPGTSPTQPTQQQQQYDPQQQHHPSQLNEHQQHQGRDLPDAFAALRASSPILMLTDSSPQSQPQYDSPHRGGHHDQDRQQQQHGEDDALNGADPAVIAAAVRPGGYAAHMGRVQSKAKSSAAASAKYRSRPVVPSGSALQQLSRSSAAVINTSPTRAISRSRAAAVATSKQQQDMDELALVMQQALELGPAAEQNQQLDSGGSQHAAVGVDPNADADDGKYGGSIIPTLHAVTKSIAAITRASSVSPQRQQQRHGSATVASAAGRGPSRSSSPSPAGKPSPMRLFPSGPGSVVAMPSMAATSSSSAVAVRQGFAALRSTSSSTTTAAGMSAFTRGSNAASGRGPIRATPHMLALAPAGGAGSNSAFILPEVASSELVAAFHPAAAPADNSSSGSPATRSNGGAVVSSGGSPDGGSTYNHSNRSVSTPTSAAPSSAARKAKPSMQRSVKISSSPGQHARPASASRARPSTPGSSAKSAAMTASSVAGGEPAASYPGTVPMSTQSSTALLAAPDGHRPLILLRPLSAPRVRPLPFAAKPVSPPKVPPASYSSTTAGSVGADVTAAAFGYRIGTGV